jgi:hypothetical protein
MATIDILLILAIILLVINLLITLFKKSNFNSNELKNEIIKLHFEISKIDPLVRTEFSINRNEVEKNAKELRNELSISINRFNEQLMSTSLENRTELTKSLKSFEEKLEINESILG